MSNHLRELTNVRNILELAGGCSVLVTGLVARTVAPDQVSGTLASGVVGVAILVTALAYAQLGGIQKKSQIRYILGVTAMVLSFMLASFVIASLANRSHISDSALTQVIR